MRRYSEAAAFKSTEVAVAKVVAAAAATKTCAWVGKYWSGGYVVNFAAYQTDLCMAAGRGIHSSTSQLNLSRFGLGSLLCPVCDEL